MKVESRFMRSMTLLALGSLGLIAVSGSTNALAGDIRAPQVAGVATLQDDPPTFYGDVVAILQENCQECHQPERPNLGGVVAPMSLVTYEETRRWASSIADQVQARLMPPWHASREFRGTFVNERYLEDHEIETLVAWAEGPSVALFSGHGAAIPEAIGLALAADETFEGAAPLRLEGRFRTRAPWPYRDRKRAREALERAVELAPVPVNHLFLGDLLQQMGEEEAARESWRAVLVSVPDEVSAGVAPLHRALARRRLALGD